MKYLVIAALLFSPASLAQTATHWVDFPPAQSRLTFDAPGLTERPTRAVEAVVTGGGKRNYRHFGYVFNKTGDAAGFAQVYVASIAANQTYFTQEPKYDQIVPSFYQEFRGQTVTWHDAESKSAAAPIGATKYRRFSALNRSCIAFGGLYGASSSLPFANGHMASGSEQIYGYYCGPGSREMSEADTRLVLSRLGFDGLGKPKSGSQSFADTMAARPDVPQRPVPDGLQRRQVLVLWEGRTGAITGSILLDPKSSTTKLEVQLPSENQTCVGISSLGSDNAGSWAIQCPNGISATGKFRGLGAGQGSIGEGVDNNGARVSFVVAGLQ